MNDRRRRDTTHGHDLQHDMPTLGSEEHEHREEEAEERERGHVIEKMFRKDGIVPARGDESQQRKPRHNGRSERGHRGRRRRQLSRPRDHGP